MKILKDFPYSKVLVLGLAKSGTAAARILLRSDVSVIINDMNLNGNHTELQTLKKMGAEIVLGSHPITVLDGVELVVKNPGIPYENIIIQEAQKRNLPIITEVELAGQLTDCPMIAITGSNGKTTTTTLIAEMLTHSGEKVKTAGNIGIVATEVAEKIKSDEKMVLELSSFQLLGVPSFKPKVAVLLNIYEAHLDYHQTFENYFQAKLNIFANQSSSDYLIYNYEDRTILENIHKAKSTLIPFSTKRKLEEGIWADQDHIYFKNEKIIERSEIVLVGEHNLENILAAVGAAKLSGASNEGVIKVLTSFYGVKHRLEFVKNIQGRQFYNDSKATNILATQKALVSFHQPTILLAGGLDRGNEFTDLIPYLKNVKAMILFGETAHKLKEIAHEANVQSVKLVKDVKEAVNEAYLLSKAGDIILLSPACASWDQYKTFEERGDMFTQAVHRLA